VTTYYVTVSMGDSAGAPDQNLFETVAGDTGSTTADAVDDTLTIAGGTGITTAVSGDTLTITTDGRPDQNLFETVAGDTGSTTADAVDDTLTIAGDATTGVDTAVSGDTVTISLDLDALPTEASTKGVTSGGAYTAYAGVASALGAHTSNAGIHIDWRSAAENLSTSGTITSTGDIETTAGDITASGQVNSATAAFSGDVTVGGDLTVDGLFDASIARTVIENTSDLDDYNSDGFYAWSTAPSNAPGSLDDMMMDVVSDGTRPTQTVWGGAGGVRMFFRRKDGGTWQSWQEVLVDGSAGDFSVTGDIESTAGNITANGQIEGATGAFSSDVTIGGNLTVSGSTSITISRTVLDSGDDLDSYTTDGRYAWAASVPTNAPGGFDNMMMNVDGDGSYPTQTVWGSDYGVRMFFRRRDGGTWQSWQKVFIDNGSGVLSTDTISESTSDTGVTVDGLLIKDGSIPEAAVTEHEAAIDHDELTNAGGNQHIDWTSASDNLSTSGTITSTGDISTDGNVYINASGPESDAFIDFFKGVGTARISWDSTNTRFNLNRQLSVDTSIETPGYIIIDNDGSLGEEAYLYFFDGGQYLKMRTDEDFEMSQDLVVPSLITDTVSESTSGNGVVVDGVTLKDGGISVTGTIDITGPSSDITTQGAISATGDIESTAGDVVANGQIEGATGAFSSDVTIGGNLTVSGSTSITISRTVLDSGDDLDSYTTDGRYAWAASVPTNAPGGLDNMMMNVDGDGSYPTQMVWGGDGGVRMFFRRRDGGTWQSWQEAFIDGSAGDFSVTGDIETTAGDITASGQVNAATGAFSSDVTISGDLTVSGSTSITEARVVLDATDDLDDFTSDGKYAWASGDLPTNAPVTDSMMMNVDGDGYYPTQTVWGGAGGVEVYYRRRDGGTWQSWRQAAILDADGELTVDDNIKANGNVYVDADGSTSNTGYLFFAGGVSKYLAWDGTNERFAISDTVNLGGNASTLARALLAGGPGIYSGSGSPEGAVTAAVGSTYHRTDGGSGTSFYVKESGTGNTGWVAK